MARQGRGVRYAAMGVFMRIVGSFLMGVSVFFRSQEVRYTRYGAQ